MNNQKPFTSRYADGRLRVILAARTSMRVLDTASMQRELDASEQWVREHFTGEMEFRSVAAQGSGGLGNCQAILEIQALLASIEYDLIVVNRLSEIDRNPTRLATFIHECVDGGARLIALEDGFDTASVIWEPQMHTHMMAAGNQLTNLN